MWTRPVDAAGILPLVPRRRRGERTASPPAIRSATRTVEPTMQLQDILGPDLRDNAVSCEARFAALEIGGIAADSRKVRPGDLFVAVPGTGGGGLGSLPQALGAGAVAVMAERAPDTLPEGIAFVKARNVRSALARAAARFYPRQPATIA